MFIKLAVLLNKAALKFDPAQAEALASKPVLEAALAASKEEQAAILAAHYAVTAEEAIEIASEADVVPTEEVEAVVEEAVVPVVEETEEEKALLRRVADIINSNDTPKKGKTPGRKGLTNQEKKDRIVLLVEQLAFSYPNKGYEEQVAKASLPANQYIKDWKRGL